MYWKDFTWEQLVQALTEISTLDLVMMIVSVIAGISIIVGGIIAINKTKVEKNKRKERVISCVMYAMVVVVGVGIVVAPLHDILFRFFSC